MAKKPKGLWKDMLEVAKSGAKVTKESVKRLQIKKKLKKR